jgi:hypothetical protein
MVWATLGLLRKFSKSIRRKKTANTKMNLKKKFFLLNPFSFKSRFFRERKKEKKVDSDFQVFFFDDDAEDYPSFADKRRRPLLTRKSSIIENQKKKKKKVSNGETKELEKK